MEKSELITIESNKDLTKYIAELAEDVKLDTYNLREKALMSSAIWAKWLSYLYHEKERINKISDAKQKLLKSKQLEAKNISDSVLRLKTEEKLLENNETLQKLNHVLKLTNDNIDYIERALTILSNFGFSIKNVTEIIKLNMTH